MAETQIDPYGTEYWDYPSGSGTALKNLNEFGRGIRQAPLRLLGAPVDLINLPLLGINALTGKQIFSEKPFAGSASLIEHGHKAFPKAIEKQTHSTPELIGAIVSDFINPAATTRTAIKATGKAAEKAKGATMELLRRTSGNPNLTEADVLAAVSQEIIKQSERGLFGMPGTGATLRTNIIKPTGSKQYRLGALDEWAKRQQLPEDKRHLHDLWSLNANNEVRAAVTNLESVRGVPRYLDEQKKIGDELDSIKDNYYEHRTPINYARIDYLKEQFDNNEKIIQTIKSNVNTEVSKQFGIPSLNELDAPRKIWNEWVNTYGRRYADLQHGTADDPALKLLQQGIKDWYVPKPIDSPSRPIRYANVRHHTVAGVDRTPISDRTVPMRAARNYERNLEAELTARDYRAMPLDKYVRQLKRSAEGRETLAQNPWIAKQLERDPKQPFFGIPKLGDLRGVLEKEVMALAQEGKLKMLPSGKLDPESSGKASVENVLRSANERILAQRVLESKDQEALNAWAKERNKTLPKSYEWDDGYSIGVIDNRSTPDQIKRDLSFQTCILNHCVGSSGHTGGKYIPMVEPHTGRVPKGADEFGLGTDYFDEVVDGVTEIRDMRDADGKPVLTMDWRIEQAPDYDAGDPGTYIISQIQGKEDRPFPAKYRPKLVEYLNHQRYEINYVDDDVINRNGIQQVDQQSVRDALDDFIEARVGEDPNQQAAYAQKIMIKYGPFTNYDLDNLAHSIDDDFRYGGAELPRFYLTIEPKKGETVADKRKKTPEAIYILKKFKDVKPD